MTEDSDQLSARERKKLAEVRSKLVDSSHRMVLETTPPSYAQLTAMSQVLGGVRDITETLKADTEMLYLDPTQPPSEVVPDMPWPSKD